MIFSFSLLPCFGSRDPQEASVFFRRLRLFPVLPALLAFSLFAAPVHPTDPAFRGFKSYLPKPREVIESPDFQVFQLLLDRQPKEGYDSYLVQILFRGQPAHQYSFEATESTLVIDLYNTGRSAVGLTKIRGGIIAASRMEERVYRELKPGEGNRWVTKSLLRVTLHLSRKVDPKLRNTLDRTLIHFRIPRTA